MVNVNLVLDGLIQGRVHRLQYSQFVLSDLWHIASVADNLETELVAIREEIADIEGRLKKVAEK